MIDLAELWRVLPDGPIGDETALDVVLRRIGRVADGDGAKLSLLRHSVIHNKLVVRDAEGRIAKAPVLPRPKSEDEVLQERVARDEAEWKAEWQREWEAHGNGREREQFNAALEEQVGGRIAALERHVAEIRGLLERLTHEVAA